MSGASEDEFDCLQWDDLDAREQINLCCDVMRSDDDDFSDALMELTTDLNAAACMALMRSMNDAALGRFVREHVMTMCRPEVERRLDSGQFFPWERLHEREDSRRKSRSTDQ